MEFSSRQLRAFLLVAQHQSFTRAAAALFITPSGLSLLIRELETQLGFRLFDRTTRQVALTAQGGELLVVVQRSLQELDAAMSGIERATKAASQSISLGAPPLIAANILPQAIRDFRALRPDLRIQVFEDTHNAIRERVEAGKLDLGLGSFGPAPGIRRTPYFRFSLMVIRPENSSALRRASTTWCALKGETLISLSPTSPFQQIVDKHLARAKVAPRTIVVHGSLDTQIAMVEAGEGIAVIPSYGLPVGRNRRVTMSRLVGPKVTLDFHLIRNRGRKLPASAEDFTAFLQSNIARWARSAGVL
jgi:LysR family transcriptional regulator, carnitine catabolism transcriptional activator